MNKGVSSDREPIVLKIFQRRKAAVGVVHCPPLPGAPRYRGEAIDTIYDHAVRDAEAYVKGGIDGLIIENHGDIPFLRPDDIGPETAATMAVIADRVRRQFDVPTGINILANAAIHALAVAKAGGAAFIRINQWANAYVANEGILEGDSAKALRYRAQLKAEDIAVFADSHVKHGAHAITADRSIAELTRDLEFFDADAVIATGQRTGDTVATDELRSIANATILPVFVGSGVHIENVRDILSIASGVIIGSSLKEGGVWWNAVEVAKVASFMEVVREVEGAR